MDANIEAKRINLKILQERIKGLKDKSIPKCWYGIKCRKLFCKFTHRFVFCKDNRNMKPSKHNLKVVRDSPECYLCEICGDLFETVGQYEEHLENNHVERSRNKVQHFKCIECSFTSPTRSALNTHVIQKHSGADIECEQCEKFFVSRQELNAHRKTHTSDDQEIRTLNNLLEGILNNDVELKECQELKRDSPLFQCDDCNDALLTKTSLKRHKEMIHRANEVKETVPKEIDPFKNNQNRKLECGLCAVEFMSLDRMDEHMDEMHQGRWKLGDPDVVFEGDEYDESLESSDEESVDSENESLESQSGEE